MKNLIFIAPPAAGKGTQSEMLVDKYNYIHISAGDLLRDASQINDEKGKMIADTISTGKFVPDEIIVDLLKNKLETINDNQAFLLDGFPRTIIQANLLEKVLNNLNKKVDTIIYLKIDKEEAKKRIVGRYNCPICHKTYNIFNEELKPLKEGICDNCGNKLTHRDDDNEKTFEVRFNTYLEVTKPLVDYFNKKNMLITIEVGNSSKETFSKIEKVLKRR